MKKNLRRFCILLLLLVVCCSRPSKEKRLTNSLIDNLPYSDSSEPQNFKPGVAHINGKIHRALIQANEGEIVFYFRVEKQARLLFGFSDSGNQNPSVTANISVDSDYPTSLKRNFPAVSNNKRVRIDLSEFAGRMIRVKLSAQGSFKKNVFWLDPVLEQFVAPKSAPPELDSFRAKHRKDNVMIVVFDALNPTHLGCYGYKRNTSPSIDSFARDSILWTQAFALAPYTLASTGSLLTGLFPDVHGILSQGDKLPEKFKTMAEVFKDAGYATAMFLATPNATKVFGYEQGFQHDWSPPRVINADEISSLVSQWLKKTKQPFFTYVHIREPHDPYHPPPEFLKRFRNEENFQLPEYEYTIPPSIEDQSRIRDAYDGNLAAGDAGFASILKTLRDLGLSNQTTVFVLADHGEAFWEHNIQGHNLTLYDEMLRIPLITHFPNEPALRNVRKSQLVTNADLFSTILDFSLLSAKEVHLNGKSILPYVFSEVKNDQRFLLAQMYRNQQYAVRSSSWKYIYNYLNKAAELYALASDPGEKKNLATTYPIVAGYCRSELEKMRQLHRTERNWLRIEPSKAYIDPETREYLRALGYIQ